MANQIHSREAAETATDCRETQQCFLADPPLAPLCLDLIRHKQYKSYNINNDQIFYHFFLFIISITIPIRTKIALRNIVMYPVPIPTDVTEAVPRSQPHQPVGAPKFRNA